MITNFQGWGNIRIEKAPKRTKRINYVLDLTDRSTNKNDLINRDLDSYRESKKQDVGNEVKKGWGKK